MNLDLCLQGRLAVYKSGVEVAWVVLDTLGSSRENWFSSDRLIATSYNQLMESVNFGNGTLTLT